MMPCPNTSHPKWKELVDKVGEEKAHLAFIRNNAEIPTPEAAAKLLRPEAAMYSLGGEAKEKAAKTYEQAREKITQGRSLTSILFDRAEPILKQLGERAYILKRMEVAANTVMETALRNGHIAWKYAADGKKLLTPWIKHQPNRGLDEMIKTHGSERWKAYWFDRMARRVKEEQAHDKNLDISDATIKAWQEPMRDAEGKLKSSWGTEKDFADIDGWVNNMNNDMINFGIATGAISKEDAQFLRKDLYVPLYRGNESLDVQRRFNRQDVSSLGSVMKQLKRAGEDLQDPMAAMINNWSTIVRSSMQNRTRIEAIRELRKIDPKGIRESKSPRDSNRMGYFDNGEQKFVHIEDPALFNALAIAPKNWMDNTLLDLVLRKPKQAITWLAVLGPVFRIKNLVRDTASTWLQNKGFTPMDTYRGLVAAWSRGPEYTEFLASGGGIRHGWLYGDDMGAHAKDALYKMGKHDGKKNIVITGPRALYDAWMQLGDTLENANRLGLYMKEKRAGKDQLQAAYTARDALDFALTGNSQALGFATQYIPFLNAYMQGLYKTGRTMGGKDSRDFWLKMGGMAAVSALIYAGMDRDKRAALTDQERMNFWHFWIGDTHLMLPKPFELGLGASWAEIVTDMFNERKDTRDVVQEFWNITRKSILSWNGLLPSDYMPVLAQPVEEVMMNKSRFTGNPVVPMGLENKPPEEQVQPWTPEMYKAIGNATGTSPLKVEHILRGYMGTIADGAAMFGDMAVRGFTDGKPTMKPEEYPIMYGFMHDDTRPNRYRTEFYDTYKEIDLLKQRLQSAVEAKDTESVKELVSDPENRKLLAVKEEAGAVRQKDGELKKIALKIQEAPGLSPDVKRKAIDAVQSERNKAMMEFREKLRWVDKQIKDART